MKHKIHNSIRQRIHWSFSLLVSLFVINAVITILTINNIKKLSGHLSQIVDPSLEGMEDFKKIMLESKMYSTNWVFLRTNEEDKKLLKKLHETDYPAIKIKMNSFIAHWANRNWVDSFNKIFTGFEELLLIEKNIMTSLKKFEDYDDPAIKLEAESKIEEEILPRTASLMNSLAAVHAFSSVLKKNENTRLERSSMKLRLVIILLAITIVCAGFFLSTYMTRVIIRPINRIRLIVNDLGKGITRTIPQPANKDEIGEMVRSVNNLSEKISGTSIFANEIGNRNFDTWYEPLSEEDTLGKALITMRDNLKSSEASLLINNKELERKNAELEQFAYVASHDLQEPLRTTTSFVELLQKEYEGKLDQKADKYISFITQSSARMETLIKDLLDYSRIGYKKELKNVDCNKILYDVLADLNTAIQETGAQIQAEALPVISGYPTEVKQLFQNLIANAIKFRKKDTIPVIKISVQRTKSYWKFAVNDNGIGIEKHQSKRIFIIFQRLHTRTEYQGSGIGLSHCKKIAELHNGKIWVESAYGEGSTFYFTIPHENNR